SERLDLPKYLQYTVPDLLPNVRHAGGPMDLTQARILVNRRLIPVDVKRLPGHHQFEDHTSLGLGTDVEVPGVVPTANVQPRNMLARRKARVGVRPHRIAIEVRVVRGRLPSIVHVGNTVPYAIVLADFDVVHLIG